MATDSPTVSLLLIGTELLTGKIVDTNGAHAVKKLSALGATTLEVRIVLDTTEVIAASINELRAKSDYVITSGGIGPTHDDLTMAAVAEAFGVPCVHRPSLQDHIDRVFGEDVVRHRVWSRMANVPDGCELLHEEGMFWPVYRMENVFVLPGVPQIFVRQFDFIQENFRGRPKSLTVLYMRLGEGRIAEPLHAATRMFPDVDFGSYPVIDTPEFRTRITVEGREQTTFDEAVAWLEERFAGDIVRTERDATTLALPESD
ncbi:MAG: molybdenum cofactor synthesis domain-containing protein [Bradymonadia bacterium]|jgi:molybdenum cofactor synthesis domain-containing protein